MSRQSQICLFAIATSILNGSTALGIVTSDAEGTHIVSTGQIVPPFGLNLDGVVRVQLLGEDLYTGQPASIWGTGAVLAGGEYILTAAHVVEPVLYTGSLSTFIVDQIIIHYNDDGSPSYSYEDFGGGGFSSRVQDHPSYLPRVLQPWNGVHAGYDVALIRVFDVPVGTPGYTLDPSSKNVQLGNDVLVAGRGRRGWGAIGETVRDGLNRVGLNTYESDQVEGLMSEYFINEYQNEDTMIAYDFERPGYPDTSYYDNYTTTGWGADEVMSAHGDSGGPTFGFDSRIIGVHSFQLAPFDGTYNANWGDVGVDAWVGHPEIYNWIRNTVYSARGWGTASNGAMMTAANWYDGTLPSGSETAEVSLGGQYTLSGPSTGQTFSAGGLYIGGSDGVKDIQHVNGGSITISGDITIDTNGCIYFTHGNITADQLIIKGESLPPGPLYYGTFYWEGNTNPTTLSVNRVIVNEYGAFVHDRGTPLALPDTDYEVHGGYIETYDDAFYVTPGKSLTMSGSTVSTAELRIQSGAEVTVTDAVSTAIISANQVTVQGTLHMDHGRVQGGALTVASGGRLEIGIGGTAGGSEFANCLLTGGADLAGVLALQLIDSYTPSLYTSIELIEASSVTGIFTAVEGVVVNNDLALAVTYAATAVVITAAIPGDANLDHMVNLTDLQIIGDNWNGTGKSWLTGDLTGDGQVNLADVQIVGDHWGQSLPPDLAFDDALAALGINIPEPGCLMLLIGALGLVRRSGQTSGRSVN